MSDPIHIISLGAGVQSSTMALMAAKGEITPMPRCAGFADTKWERLATYLWLKWLCGCDVLEFKPGRFCAREGVWQNGVLPFPVHVVSNGDLRDEQINARVRGRAENGERWASLPYFTMQPDSDSEGRIKRQCTKEYKIDPIERWMRYVILGLKPHQRAPNEVVIVQWRGISTDEATRIKDSRERWYKTRHPLAMEAGMSRGDCQEWLMRNYKRKAPRSSCIGCPNHRNAQWREIKDTPNEWVDVTAFDDAIRVAGGMRGETFLHRSCKPLSEVDFSTEEERGQLSLFNNECEGMCGV